jgi:hypothetical protein
MSIKCNNLDELTNIQYNSNITTPALSQGLKFKKYQNRYNRNYDNYINENNFVEGFEGSNKNPYLGKVLIFFNDGRPIGYFVTDKGILREIKEPRRGSILAESENRARAAAVSLVLDQLNSPAPKIVRTT